MSDDEKKECAPNTLSEMVLSAEAESKIQLIVDRSLSRLIDAVLFHQLSVAESGGPKAPPPLRDALPGWEDAVALAKGGQQEWPIRHVEGAPKAIPWPIEWICCIPVELDVSPSGFIEQKGQCIYTGRIVGLMNTQDIQTYGCRCSRCGVVMATAISPNANGLVSRPGIPSCLSCREIVKAVEPRHV